MCEGHEVESKRSRQRNVKIGRLIKAIIDPKVTGLANVFHAMEFLDAR